MRTLLRPWGRRAGFLGAAATLAFLGAVLPARADLIFLKDGFVLVGKVKEERTHIVDRFSKTGYTVPKGFFFVDDGPRRFFFSPLQKKAQERSFLRAEDRASNYLRVGMPPDTPGMPVIVQMVDTPEFNNKWLRNVKYRTTTYMLKVPQRLQELNSSYAVVQATKHFYWTSFYLTRELGLEQVQRLLAHHPDYNDSFTLATWVRLTPRRGPRAISACSPS